MEKEIKVIKRDLLITLQHKTNKIIAYNKEEAAPAVN